MMPSGPDTVLSSSTPSPTLHPPPRKKHPDSDAAHGRPGWPISATSIPVSSAFVGPIAFNFRSILHSQKNEKTVPRTLPRLPLTADTSRQRGTAVTVSSKPPPPQPPALPGPAPQRVGTDPRAPRAVLVAQTGLVLTAWALGRAGQALCRSPLLGPGRGLSHAWTRPWVPEEAPLPRHPQGGHGPRNPALRRLPCITWLRRHQVSPHSSRCPLTPTFAPSSLEERQSAQLPLWRSQHLLQDECPRLRGTLQSSIFSPVYLTHSVPC